MFFREEEGGATPSFFEFGFKTAKEVGLPRECQHCKQSARPLRNIQGVGPYVRNKFVCVRCFDLVLEDFRWQARKNTNF